MKKMIITTICILSITSLTACATKTGSQKGLKNLHVLVYSSHYQVQTFTKVLTLSTHLTKEAQHEKVCTSFDRFSVSYGLF